MIFPDAIQGKVIAREVVHESTVLLLHLATGYIPEFGSLGTVFQVCSQRFPYWLCELKWFTRCFEAFLASVFFSSCLEVLRSHLLMSLPGT